jgi:hypothetical protein
LREEHLELRDGEGARGDVSLCLLVKNGESVLRRLLDCVGPRVSEVVAVLDDCTDDTAGMLGAHALTHRLDLTIVSISPPTHPDLYLRDVPETYAGRPLCGEHLPGPHEGRPFLADFAGARNVGWGLCQKPWRLFLDADDVVLDPESIGPLCAALDRRGLDVVATPYHASGRAPGMRERLCRNLPEIVWEGRVHEGLSGHRPDRIATVADRLVVRDLGDSTGEGTRIPNRNLKILYHRARSRRWNVTPREAYYLGVEALRAGMLGLAASAAEDCAGRSSHPEERASACVIRGRAAELGTDLLLAACWYSRSIGARPSADAAARMAAICRLMGRDEEARKHLALAELLRGRKSSSVLGGELP